MKKLNFLTIICIYVCVFVFFAKTSSFAANSEIIYDNYYITSTMGVKTGYLKELQRKKIENGKKYIVTNRHFEQKIKRVNNTIQVIQDTNYIEEESGKPVSFVLNSESMGEKTKISGEFVYQKENRKSDDCEIHANFDVNGVKSSKIVKIKEKILFPYAIKNLYKYPDSKNIDYYTIEPSLDLKVIKIKTKSMGQENLASDGLNYNYKKYKVTMSILPGISGYEWHDRNGNVVKESISLFKIENVLSSKDAVANITGESDIFANSLIPITHPILSPDTLNELVYKITLNNSTPDIFLQDDRQKIILENPLIQKTDKKSKKNHSEKNISQENSNNIIYLKVNTVKPTADKFPYPVNSKGLEEYLESGPFIMPDGDKISSAAKSLVAGETNTYIIAKKMESWVYNNITNKNYSLDFANAIEVLETKSGDCTEHSVLLASLLRAAGIPSKVVVGLIYTDYPSPSFGYHMWNMAYLGNNKWLNLDATLPYQNFVPTHIAMGESHLNNISDRTELLINILKSMSDIKIEVLNNNKPIISKMDNGILKINFSNAPDSDFLTIKTINNSSATIATDGFGIKNISLGTFEEKDYLRSGSYSFIKGDIQKALNDFNLLYSSIDQNDDYSYINLGTKLTEFGFFNLAEKCFDSVKNKDIWNYQIQNTKNIYFPAKKYTPTDELVIATALSKIEYRNLPQEGVDLINKYKNKFKKNDDFGHYLLSKAYLSMNNSGYAIDELNAALKINPNSPIYRMELAKIYIQKNSSKSAERELDLLKNLMTKYQIKDNNFLQDYEEQTCWLKYKDERKNPVKSKYYKAKYYEAKKEYNVALELLNGIVNISDDKALVYDTIGSLYFKTANYDKAEQNFNKALEINKKDAEAFIGLGKIYQIKAKNKDALANFQKALEIEPANISIKLELAEVYELLGQEEESYKLYRQVIQAPQPSAESYYKLGMMYLRSGDMDEAEKYLKTALSFNPMNSTIWIDIAGLEISKENYTTAENYLKPIASTDNKNQYYYFYYGLIYKATGNIEMAKTCFNNALHISPTFAEALNELNRL